MPSRRCLLSILVLIATAVGHAAEPPSGLGATRVAGVVYWDSNENGVRDGDEPGAANVPLNIGYEIIHTGADGRYSQASEKPFLTVSLRVPSGSWPVGPWFQVVEGDRGDVNFGLRRIESRLPFTFV